jgi:hypothetical protein
MIRSFGGWALTGLTTFLMVTACAPDDDVANGPESAGDSGAGGASERGEADSSTEGGFAGVGGEDGAGVACEVIPLDDSCATGTFQFTPRDSCPETPEQGANYFCDLLVERNAFETIGDVSIYEAACGGKVLEVSYGWAAERFFFDADDRLVAHHWGTDTGGGQCAGVVPCQVDYGTEVTWCDELHGDLRGQAGAGGQGGDYAGGAGGAGGAGD